MRQTPTRGVLSPWARLTISGVIELAHWALGALLCCRIVGEACILAPKTPSARYTEIGLCMVGVLRRANRIAGQPVRGVLAFGALQAVADG